MLTTKKKVVRRRLKSQDFSNMKTETPYFLLYLNPAQTDDAVLLHRRTRGNIYSEEQPNHVTAEQTPQQKFHLHTSLTSIHMSPCWLYAHARMTRPFALLQLNDTQKSDTLWF